MRQGRASQGLLRAQAKPASRVAAEHPPRLLLVTQRAEVVAALRPLVECEGWSLVATPEAGATPEMIGCCDLVVVDLSLGHALVRWLAQHARGRLAGLCGSWDIAQHDVADCCHAFVYYPQRGQNLRAILSAP